MAETEVAPVPQVEESLVKFVNEKNKEVSKDEYIRSLYEGHLNKLAIMPEAILGFRLGESLDFEMYSELGFEHPRDHEYYDLDKQNPEFLNILSGIRVSKTFDDAILVYPYQKKDGTWVLPVLDGATRTTCASIIKSEEPDSFRRVDVVIFRGTEDEAKAAMVRRNMIGRNRSLSDQELVRAIRRFSDSGWTVREIRERLGQTESFVQKINNALMISERLIPELLQKFENGEMKFTVAAQTSKKTPRAQESVLTDIKAGKKVKAKNVETIQKPSTLVDRWDAVLNETFPFLEKSMEEMNIPFDERLFAILLEAMSKFITDLDKKVQSLSDIKEIEEETEKIEEMDSVEVVS